MATEKQKLAVQAIVENGGVVSRAMEQVGYTKATAKTPQKLTQSKGFRELVDPIVEQMKRERDRAIKRMAGKISKAKYRDLVDGIDKLTRNIQLLEGKPTEINKITAEDVRERLKQLRSAIGRTRSTSDE